MTTPLSAERRAEIHTEASLVADLKAEDARHMIFELLDDVERLTAELSRERRLTNVMPDIERNSLRQDVANLREKIEAAKVVLRRDVEDFHGVDQIAEALRILG